MSKMTQRDKIMLLVVAGLVALGGIYQFYLSPAKTEREEAIQKVTDLETQVQTARTQLTQLQTASKGGGAATGKQEVRLVDKLRLAKAYPYDRDIPAAILQIEQIAKEANVSLGPATPDAGTDYAGVTGTAFTVKVSGRFFEVQDFMYRMHNRVTITPFGKLKVKGRLFAITAAELGPEEGEQEGSTTSPSTVVDANLTVVVFSKGSAAPAAADADVANTTPTGGTN